jgi:hypothetical protein
MGRYKHIHTDNTVERVAVGVSTLFLSEVVGYPTTYKTKIKDTKTGNVSYGRGSSKTKADKEAWKSLKSKK